MANFLDFANSVAIHAKIDLLTGKTIIAKIYKRDGMYLRKFCAGDTRKIGEVRTHKA